jgi:hypothetical protein
MNPGGHTVRRLAACLAAFAALSIPVAASLADPGGGLAQNVVADNSQGGTVLALSGLVAVRDGAADGSAAKAASATDPSNFARANAHDCATPCQALAAAFQIVLVPAGTTVSAPQNVALATNVNCDHCGSFAYAYQYVVDVARDVSLSGHARHQIAQLRQQASQDVRAGLDYPTLDAKLHDLATQFRTVVDGDLAQQHVGEDHKHSFQSVKQNPAQ